MRQIVSGKPFFTKESFKFFFRRIILPCLVIYTVAAVVTGVRDLSIDSDEYAAVLLSDNAFWQYDYWASPCAFLGSYIPWTHYFNNRNMKVKWFFRAKGSDFEKAVKDQKCQSIVLVGHGDIDSWQATDMEISNSIVTKMMQGVPKKKGEWLQLTCGGDSRYFKKMGTLVMQDKDNVYTYSQSVTTYVFIYDALSGFRYLNPSSAVGKCERGNIS